jgi:O-antigen/teichoic acid export membrane protein
MSGIKWTFAASIAQRALALAATVILARILSPADFGLFALAFVMIDGFGIFKSLGFDSALVRRKNDIEKAANTAFFLIPAMGMILFSILFILAPIGAKFLGNPSVANVIRALAVIFVISCFGKVPQTILYRDMKFKYKSMGEVSAQLVYVLVAVSLALNKFGVWSLVIAYVLKTITQISIEWYFSGWKPKFEFDREIAWDMFHFGKYVLAGGIVWFLSSNLDNIIVGKFLGVAMLGFYAIAMNASNILNDYLLGKISIIMYPAYSRIQEDSEDVKRVMLKAVRYVSIIAFPFSFALFIFAPDILRIVFGAKWLPAAGILRILAFVGIFRALGSAMWPIFLARGRSKTDLQVSLVQIGVFFALIVPLALEFKLVGVGIAVLLSSVISFCIGLIRTKRLLKIKISQIFNAVRPALICSLLMAVIAFFLRSLTINKNIYINFMLLGGLSALVYFFATYLMNRNIFKDIKEALV